jgi:hypothetical protein
MQAQRRPKRGRPKIDRRKEDCLDIRLETAEKQAFKDAAELAGLDLSAWVRERLRAAAREELVDASLPVKFLMNDTLTASDHLTKARYVPSSKIYLQFSDGFEGTWTFRQLQLSMTDMVLSTIKVSSSKTSVEVRSKSGDKVQLDSSSLRYLVDPAFAAKIDKSIADLHMPIAEAKEATRRSKAAVDPRWKGVCDDDLLE